MSLQKVKVGSNMYQGWATHCHSHLRGKCSHACSYCYAQDFEKRYQKGFWSGPLRLEKKELSVKYGTGKTIFIEHMNDLFARDVPPSFIRRILSHCEGFTENIYVFQTKNPGRYFDILDGGWHINAIFGTTIETNRDIPGCLAPQPQERAVAMWTLPPSVKRFVTIEPVMDFDVEILSDWIARIDPAFLNLGADSKNHGLPEPTVEKIMELVEALKKNGIELREKHNLARLKQK